MFVKVDTLVMVFYQSFCVKCLKHLCLMDLSLGPVIHTVQYSVLHSLPRKLVLQWSLYNILPRHTLPHTPFSASLQMPHLQHVGRVMDLDQLCLQLALKIFYYIPLRKQTYGIAAITSPGYNEPSRLLHTSIASHP